LVVPGQVLSGSRAGWSFGGMPVCVFERSGVNEVVLSKLRTAEKCLRPGFLIGSGKLHYQ
ncbi:hypothetical protein QQF64_035289, partial [Cirrhinus molitorella]